MQVHSSGACRLWVAFPQTTTQEVSSGGSQNSPSYIYVPGWGDIPVQGQPSSPSGTSTISIFSFTDPQPLGTCEKLPTILEQIEYEDWYTDKGGFRISDDVLFAGKDALVAGVLTRYREDVYRRLAETPLYAGEGRRGDKSGDIGTMMVRERKVVILWVQFDYGGGGPLGQGGFPTSKPVHITGGMPGGYRYLGAVWKGPARHSPGTGAKKIQFLFHCHRTISPLTGAYVCADEDMSALVGKQWDVTP